MIYTRIETRESIYDTLVEWWTKHNAFGGKVLMLEDLPRYVFVAFADNKDLAAIPVYRSDSNFCYIGWVTTNPETSKFKNYKALDLLYKEVSQKMTEKGYDHIVSKANNKSLQRLTVKNGFIDAGETTYYIKNL